MILELWVMHSHRQEITKECHIVFQISNFCFRCISNSVHLRYNQPIRTYLLCLSKWNAEILKPRDGKSGHCIPKDTKVFINSPNIFKSRIPQTAVEIDEDYIV